MAPRLQRTEPRKANTVGPTALVSDIAAVLSPADPAAAAGQTWSTVALPIGTLQMARALADPDLAAVVLEHGIDSALQLLGLGQAGESDT